MYNVEFTMYNENRMRKSAHGFTLVELLVVIAIMAITGVFVLSNYRSFGEDQKLKNAVLDIQSQIRTAQANATSNIKCNDQYSASWQVEFTNATDVKLKCLASAVTKKTITLPVNITQAVLGTGFNCPSPPFVNFDPLTGEISFGNSRCTALTITLTNSKGTRQSLKIEQGGQIYEPTPAP